MRRKTPAPKKRRQSTVAIVVHNMRTTCLSSTYRTMRNLQRTVNLCIPKLSFARLVREVFQEFTADYRIQGLALEALQESAEWYLVNLFSDANRCCAHAGRVTIQPRDIHLVLDLRGPQDTGFRKL